MSARRCPVFAAGRPAVIRGAVPTTAERDRAEAVCTCSPLRADERRRLRAELASEEAPNRTWSEALWYNTLSVAVVFHVYRVFFRVVRWTTRFEVRWGDEVPEERRMRDWPVHAIFTSWHRHVVTMSNAMAPLGDYPAHIGHPVRFSMIMHPVPALRAARRLCNEYLGVDLPLYGSSGHGGQQVLDQSVESLRAGMSAMLCVDGPRGPIEVMKRGATTMALQSGVPVVPCRFIYGRPWASPRMPHAWDRKHLPLPFGHVIMELGAPVFVESQEDVARAEAELSAFMSNDGESERE